MPNEMRHLFSSQFQGVKTFISILEKCFDPECYIGKVDLSGYLRLEIFNFNQMIISVRILRPDFEPDCRLKLLGA